VAEGQVLTNHLVRLACQRHLDDLASSASRGLRFDVQAARHAIAFFGFLRHSKGEWAGETFALAPWQSFVVGSLFGWQRTDGLRRFRTAYCAVPRKNGKSTLSAGIALYLLVADGEQGAEIYSAATTRDQARIVFDEAKRMVGSSPALKRRVQVLINNLNVEASASRFMPLSSDASSMDGLNVHGAIIDELHAQDPPRRRRPRDRHRRTPPAPDLRDHHRGLRSPQHLLRAPRLCDQAAGRHAAG
jgi:phage terminase large subunit-like protein